MRIQATPLQPAQHHRPAQQSHTYLTDAHGDAVTFSDWDSGVGVAMNNRGKFVVGSTQAVLAGNLSAQNQAQAQNQQQAAQMQQQQAASQQQFQQQQAGFNRAWGACMSGRGYTVQ